MSSAKWFYWFECNPTPSFIASIRRVFPGFNPCDAGWDKLGKTIEFKAGKTVAEVQMLQPHEVELFLDLFFPDASESAIDESQRILDGLTTETRMALAALAEWPATSLETKMTRREIQDRTNMTDNRIRRVMEKELPKVGVPLVETKTGPGGGVWLTPEGAIVAAKINKYILPEIVTSPQQKSIRRIVRA